MATGSFGTTALTAITSQNTLGVQAIHSIPKEHIESQMQSVLSGTFPTTDKVLLQNRSGNRCR